MRALFLVAAIGAASPTWAETVELDLGNVVLAVSDSPTAQVFHIVDQLSEWDAFTHRLSPSSRDTRSSGRIAVAIV